MLLKKCIIMGYSKIERVKINNHRKRAELFGFSNDLYINLKKDYEKEDDIMSMKYLKRRYFMGLF